MFPQMPAWKAEKVREGMGGLSGREADKQRYKEELMELPDAPSDDAYGSMPVEVSEALPRNDYMWPNVAGTGALPGTAPPASSGYGVKALTR